MAESSQTVPSVALPIDPQAVALRSAAACLTLVRTQTATALSGCPPRSGGTTLLASSANSMFSRAVRGAGLVDLIDRLAET